VTLPDHERMMRPERAPKSPTTWVALDAEVEAARVRTVELHDKAREASDGARAASEALAEVERADRARRSEALAGGKDDPGRSTATIAKAERASAEASERADVLSAAVAESHRRLEDVVRARREPWERAARAVLAERSSELRAAVESLAGALEAWRQAHQGLAVAVDERARRKVSPLGATFLAVGSAEVSTDGVLAALAALADRGVAPADEFDADAVRA
jgi:hypothetical protein